MVVNRPYHHPYATRHKKSILRNDLLTEIITMKRLQEDVLTSTVFVTNENPGKNIRNIGLHLLLYFPDKILLCTIPLWPCPIWKYIPRHTRCLVWNNDSRSISCDTLAFILFYFLPIESFSLSYRIFNRYS